MPRPLQIRFGLLRPAAKGRRLRAASWSDGSRCREITQARRVLQGGDLEPLDRGKKQRQHGKRIRCDDTAGRDGDGPRIVCPEVNVSTRI